VIECRFVRIRRSDRLHFKLNPVKAGRREGLSQTRDGESLIVFTLCAHKPHRAAHHRIRNRSLKLAFGMTAKIREDF